MLLEFKVGGAFSFGKKMEGVDLQAKPKSRIKNTKYEYNFHIDRKCKPMKSAILFGKNASGKTNLFASIQLLLDIINNGFRSSVVRSHIGNVFNKQCDSIEFYIKMLSGKNNIFEYNIA